MTYNNFVEYVRNKCNYETIYSDGEGRVILVITLLDAYTMAHRAPKDWVGLTDEESKCNKKWVSLTDEEMFRCSYDADGFMIDREVAMRVVEAKLKEKNCG